MLSYLGDIFQYLQGEPTSVFYIELCDQIFNFGLQKMFAGKSCDLWPNFEI